MSSSDPNPYQAPNAVPALPVGTGADVVLPEKDLKKANAIIKDAGQFWLACILCVFCALIGAIIVPVWYSIRLLQWHGLRKRFPALMNVNAAPGSLSKKFQSSQWKLIVGLVMGCVIFVLVLGLLLLPLFITVEPQSNVQVR